MRMRRHRRAESGRPPPVSVAKARRSVARKRSPGNRGRLGGEAIHGVRSHSPIRSTSDHNALVEALAARGESPAGIRPTMHPPWLRCSFLKYWPDILGRRALPLGRLVGLGARRDFHHGLLPS